MWYSERIKNVLLGIILPAMLLFIWKLALWRGVVSPQLLVSPEKVAWRLWKMIENGVLWKNLRSSIFIVLMGFGWGSAAGLILGTAMGLSGRMNDFIHPMFHAVRQVPLFGWMPFLILLLGIEERFRIVFVGIGTFYLMTLNTYEGVSNVSKEYLEVAEVLECGYLKRFFSFIVPEAMPSIFVGLRNGFSMSWMSVVGAEMIASSLGIGFLMTNARTMFKYDIVYATIIVIGVVGFVTNYFLASLEKYVLRWRKGFIDN
jgi:sulfonate transport system permease protein